MKTHEQSYTGTKIKPILAAQGRKARWLAGQVDISEGFLSNVLSGKRSLNATTARRVAAILQVPFFVLFDSPDGGDMRSSGDGEEQAA